MVPKTDSTEAVYVSVNVRAPLTAHAYHDKYKPTVVIGDGLDVSIHLSPEAACELAAEMVAAADELTAVTA